MLAETDGERMDIVRTISGFTALATWGLSASHVERARYARLMLAFLAAIIPTVASLIVAGALLIGYTHKRRDVRKYAIIQAWYQQKKDSMPQMPDSSHFDKYIAQLDVERKRRLESAGLDTDYGTHTRVGRMIQPQVPQGSDVWQQWLLLGGAVIGVALISIDFALSGQ